MAGPQLEDGYVRIANRVFENLARIRISGQEWQCLCFILRRTYGWNKKQDRIPLSQFQEATGMNRPGVIRSIKKLLAKRIITSIKSDTGNTYGLNKNADDWKPVSKQIPSIKSDTSTSIIFAQNLVSKEIPSKDSIKDNIKTDKVVFDFWNEQKIVVHRSLTDKIRRTIQARLNEYSSEELCKAIANYAEIVKSPEYWWNHRWTLKDFLDRGVERFLDGEVAKQNYRGTRHGTNKGRLPTRYETPDEFNARYRNGRGISP